MKIRNKILIQKCCLNAFNGIFLALGLMLLAFGLWLLFDRDNLFGVLFSSGKNQLVAYISCILLGIGSVITFTSAVGFLGSVTEIKCLLVTYVSFQLLVFVSQMTTSLLIFMKKAEVHSQWNNGIDEVISEYRNESLAEQKSVRNILNTVQHDGCEEYLNTWFENHVLILTAITISLLITQVFLVVLTGQLFRSIKRNNIWPYES